MKEIVEKTVEFVYREGGFNGPRWNLPGHGGYLCGGIMNSLFPDLDTDKTLLVTVSSRKPADGRKHVTVKMDFYGEYVEGRGLRGGTYIMEDVRDAFDNPSPGTVLYVWVEQEESA